MADGGRRKPLKNDAYRVYHTKDIEIMKLIHGFIQADWSLKKEQLI
jgi:hypothetical protein